MAPNPAEAPNAKPPPSTIEFEPPLACVRRILKHSLPDSTNVGKDASTAFARACGIFIIYLTSCANDFARESKRQTITANDVLAAVRELEFGEFVPDMNACLEQYRTAEKSKKDAKAAAAKAKAAANSTTSTSSIPVKAGEEDDEGTGHGEDGKEEDDEDEEVVAAAEEDTAKPPAEKRPREDPTSSSAEEANNEEEPQAKRPKTDDEAPSAEG